VSGRPSVTIRPEVRDEIRKRLDTSVLRKPTPPCSIVVFGGSGDLAHRKIFPALFNLLLDGLLPVKFSAIGVSRGEMSDEAYQADMGKAVAEFSRRKPAPEAWSRVAEGMSFIGGEFDDPKTYERLRVLLEKSDAERGTEGNRIFYLATPPSVFEKILTSLRDAGLIYPAAAAGKSETRFSRVIIEKPFGRDLASARELNHVTGSVLDESQIYRIDHYLGKETVQNLLVLRFANAIFEPIWNRKYVDHIQITAAEEVGVGHRAGYYEEAGALRDMVQSHLLQVLALVAMEPPVSVNADAVRDQTAQALRSLRPLSGEEITNNIVRAQYRNYRREPDVNPYSRTPTYVALAAYIDNWRWQGVPFYIRTGKNLKHRVTEVAVRFQDVPLSLFGPGQSGGRLGSNVLVIRIQPDEGIALHFNAKVPGDAIVPADVLMDFRYSSAFDRQPPEAYERLLHDCMEGDATLFARRDAVEAAWEYVTPILDAWQAEDTIKSGESIPQYEPVSWGPRESDDLLARTSRQWRRPEDTPAR